MLKKIAVALIAATMLTGPVLAQAPANPTTSKSLAVKSAPATSAPVVKAGETAEKSKMHVRRHATSVRHVKSVRHVTHVKAARHGKLLHAKKHARHVVRADRTAHVAAKPTARVRAN